MDLGSFFIEFPYNNETEYAEVKPCCQENDVIFYDVLMNNQYQFTITPSVNGDDDVDWKVALKNADKHVDQELVSLIGSEIDKHLL